MQHCRRRHDGRLQHLFELRRFEVRVTERVEKRRYFDELMFANQLGV
jgi:hypothetical protein